MTAHSNNRKLLSLYEYDEWGRAVKTAVPAPDTANQLVRENLCYGTGSTNNKTVTYEYDDWGNLLNKYTYLYTTTALSGGTPGSSGSQPSPAPGINVYLTDANGTPLAGGVFEVYDYYQNTWSYLESITTNANGYAYTSWGGYESRVRQESAPVGYTMTDSSFHDVGSSGTQSLCYTNNATSTVQPTARTEYVYGNSAWGDQLTQIKTYSISQTLTNTQTLSYDSMGNPTSYLGATLSWQGKQLATATKNGNNYGYFYDENGLRLRKTTNGIATNYYYNGSVLIGMTQGTTYQRFSYDASGNVLSVNYNGTEYYYLRNAQGDIVAMIDSTGTKVVQYSYDSWGKQLSCSGSLSTTLGLNQPFRYRGYVYDTETGWYYLQSRYYDPEVGRFISADVLLSTGQGVLGDNAYTYCLNNPMNMKDSSGTCSEFLCWTIDCKETDCPTSKNFVSNPDFIHCSRRDMRCYGYALQYAYRAVGKEIPKDYAEKRIYQQEFFGYPVPYDVNNIAYSMCNDINIIGNGVFAEITTDISTIEDNQFVIATRVSDGGGCIGAPDYHFAIRLSDGTWADKLGTRRARAGVINSDGEGWGKYTSDVVYILVTVG